MHPLDKFRFCPVCGSSHFADNDEKSRRCQDCGFTYYINPSAANVAIIINDRDELLVATRLNDPARGTLDLPGGFADIGESVEEGVVREVREETALEVTSLSYLFSRSNLYTYSGFTIPTLDSFFLCEVADWTVAEAHDDAQSLQWIPLDEIRIEAFGLRSIREGLAKFLDSRK